MIDPSAQDGFIADPFAGDGCTGWIDGWQGKEWRACCDAHDTAYLEGTTTQDFNNANTALRDCVSQIDPFMGWIMFAAVATVGALFFRFGPKKRKST